MLSKKEIICPESLLKIAKTKGPAKAVIVNAVKPVSIESAKQALDARTAQRAKEEEKRDFDEEEFKEKYGE